MSLLPRHAISALILLILVVNVSCGEQGSSPVPQPVPDFVRQSTHELQQEKLLVVGLPGAVAGEGKVRVQDRKGGAEVVVDATSVGTFTAVLPADQDADLALQFETDQGKSEWLLLRKAQTNEPIPHLGLPRSYQGPVSSPDAQGMVTVTNDAGPGQPLLLDATPEVDLIVSNGDTSEVVTSKTDETGRFSVKLPGSSGDWIHILLVSPKETDLTSDFVSHQVP
jgi:hypothetical protein